MKIIEHRVNHICCAPEAKYAEVDVQVADDGQLVVKHDPDEDYLLLEEYLRRNKFEGYFIDIKQNLHLRYLHDIIDAFGTSRVLGIFDLPMPSLLFAIRDHLPVYTRVSEYESYKYADRVWLDPLDGQEIKNYENLLNQVSYCKDIFIVCPSLHKKSIEKCKKVWSYLKCKSNIMGIVTKYPWKAEEFINA